jgi:cytochrome c peroxidase
MLKATFHTLHSSFRRCKIALTESKQLHDTKRTYMRIFKLIANSLILSSIITQIASASEMAAQKYKSNYLRPDAIPYPSSNAYSKARAELGKSLFFDPRLSGSDWISCATCHNPALSWGDGLPTGIGHGMGALGRRSPTILNLAWAELLMWDGRAPSLEEQALGPIQASVEMNLPMDQLLSKLSSYPGYKPMFERAYPKEGITKETIGKAIATFERTIVSGEAPFDRWVKGEKKAISESAKRGFVLFNEKAKCASCHTGWRFTDDGFHDVGVSGDDIGRGKIMPDFPAVQFAFKTPTLRNADHRKPFMHNGTEKTLLDVVELYNAGGRVKRPSVSENVTPLGLTSDEKADLVTFMGTLTSKDKDISVPVLPR